MGIKRKECWAFVWRGCGIIGQIARAVPGVLMTHRFVGNLESFEKFFVTSHDQFSEITNKP
jgi:hypothetical protein